MVLLFGFPLSWCKYKKKFFLVNFFDNLVNLVYFCPVKAIFHPVKIFFLPLRHKSKLLKKIN